MKPKQLRHTQTLNQFSRLAPPEGAAVRPISQQNLLFWVAAEDQPQTPTELAEQMGLSKAAITKMLNPLIDEKLLYKTVDPDDNRSFTLDLTEAGIEEVHQLSEDYFKPLNTLRAGMGKKHFKLLLNLLNEANSLLVEDA